MKRHFKLSWRPPVAGLCHGEKAVKCSESRDGFNLETSIFQVTLNCRSTSGLCGHAGRQNTSFVSGIQSSKEVRGPNLTH